jgi:hypothetical protein
LQSSTGLSSDIYRVSVALVGDLEAVNATTYNETLQEAEEVTTSSFDELQEET